MQDRDMDRKAKQYDLSGWVVDVDGFILYARIYKAWLHICVSGKNFDRSPFALRTMRQNLPSLGDENYTTEEAFEYLHEITALFLPVVRELRPEVDQVGKLTLADLQVTHTYKCQLAYVEEKPVASVITQRLAEEHNYVDEEALDESLFPHLDPAEVEVVGAIPSTMFYDIHRRVIARDQTLFWKSATFPGQTKELVKKYAKIQQANADPGKLRISRLYGLVVNGRGKIWGHLFHWVDIESLLDWKAVERSPYKTLVKWGTQINRTVCILHEFDVIWGDVKAGNVGIDKNGDAVVIDLEGRATKGWIDEDVMGTKAGDLQGLSRLMEYIFEEDNALRTKEKNR